MIRSRGGRKLLVVAVLVSAGPPVRLSAQCPDGSPPPCRALAAAPVRRNPPLDDRTWIVLPFDNLSRAPDIDWLRDASVNLLYLDLSRWQDIRVIDDERVADLLRELPATMQARPNLQAGLQVARRAGAGTLVMGDLLRVGARTSLVAKVYSVRNGQRVRSVQQEVTNPDSLGPAFGKLARGVLNVAPPPGANIGAIGTVSVDAYRAYLAGLKALNAWDLDSATAAFKRAIALDSTFALALFKLSLVYAWVPNFPEARRYAEAATRFAQGLPDRERQLVSGMAAQATDRWTDACDIYGALLRRDSTDVEAWYGFGECSFHNPQVDSVPGDPPRWVFHTSWNTSLRAFVKTLDLDPSYHLAYRHVPDMLGADGRIGCRGQSMQSCAGGLFVAPILRQGDTLLLVPEPAPTQVRDPFSARQLLYRRSGASRSANLAVARDLAARWVAAGPGERRARETYARMLLRTGDVAGALRQLEGLDVAAVKPGDRTSLRLLRLEALLKGREEDIAAAARLLDSVPADGDTAAQSRLQAAIVGAAFGRFRPLAQAPWPPAVPPSALRYVIALARLGAGAVPDSLVEIGEKALEDALRNRTPAQQAAIRAAGLVPTTLLGFRLLRGGPALDTASQNARVRVLAFLAQGDRARARRELAAADSALLQQSRESPSDAGFLLSAEGHLELADTAGALEMLRQGEERWRLPALLESIAGPLGFAELSSLGRTWLLYADVALATGDRATARVFYQRAVNVWSGGDPEVQPFLARATAALERLN